MAKEQWGAGDPSKWSDWGTVKLGDARKGRDWKLIWGEYKHSYSDNKMYIVPLNPDYDKGIEPLEFDGHRILIDVHLTSKNYRKESQLSGDEVRKGGSCKILADGEVVFEFFFRDVHWALRKADSLIGKLSEHPLDWLKKEEREKLVGRKVYYYLTPAVISSVIVDQGCVILKTEDGKSFPQAPWQDIEPEDDMEVKIEIIDSNVWWWRD